MYQEEDMDLKDENIRAESEKSEEIIQDETALMGRGRGSQPLSNEPVFNPPGDEAIHACQRKIRRLRGHYNDVYRVLFNDTVMEASGRSKDEGSTPLAPSQIGVSTWTAGEKEIFFNTLARLGRDDLPGIAAAIRSKSEAEVHDYILLLQEGLVQQQLNAPHHRLVGPTEILAANDLSQACCDSLDKAAEALAWHQLAWEMRQEREKHGDLWLLDRSLADHIEECFVESTESVDADSEHMDESVSNREDTAPNGENHIDGANSPILDILPAAKLLKLNNWMELSERVFMNAGPPYPADNYRSVADADERPSITLTAFNDFHTLAVSITRRLVQTVLFQTTSRLRATGGGRKGMRERRLWIKRKDVVAATKMLGMNQDSKLFWAKAARRCHLIVYEGQMPTARRPNRSDTLAYDEVERLLGGNVTSDGPSRNTPKGLLKSLCDTEDEGSSTDADVEDHVPTAQLESGVKENVDGDSEDISDPECVEDASGDNGGSDIDYSVNSTLEESADASTASEGDPTSLMQEEGHGLEEHAEQFDRLASRIAERQLWDMLQQQPPPGIKDEDTAIQQAPATRRKRARELHDWRDWTDYESEWERFAGTIVSAEDLAQLRANKRLKGNEGSKLAEESGARTTGDMPSQKPSAEHDAVTTSTNSSPRSDTDSVCQQRPDAVPDPTKSADGSSSDGSTDSEDYSGSSS